MSKQMYQAGIWHYAQNGDLHTSTTVLGTKDALLEPNNINKLFGSIHINVKPKNVFIVETQHPYGGRREGNITFDKDGTANVIYLHPIEDIEIFKTLSHSIESGVFSYEIYAQFRSSKDESVLHKTLCYQSQRTAFEKEMHDEYIKSMDLIIAKFKVCLEEGGIIGLEK